MIPYSVNGRSGGLVVTLQYYRRWSLTLISPVVRFECICKNATKRLRAPSNTDMRRESTKEENAESFSR